MKPRSWLVEKYGERTADQIIAKKKEQQASKKPGEPEYCMYNPDLPDDEESLINLNGLCSNELGSCGNVACCSSWGL